MNFAKLPHKVRQVLTEELGFRPDTIEKMSLETCLDAYLRWEGIIGYTSVIMGIVDSTKGK